MAVENDEIFGGHSRPKMAFKTTSQAAQVASFVKRGSEPKKVECVTATKSSLRNEKHRVVTAVTAEQPSSARFVMKCACLCRVGGRDHIRHK